MPNPYRLALAGALYLLLLAEACCLGGAPAVWPCMLALPLLLGWLRGRRRVVIRWDWVLFCMRVFAVLALGAALLAFLIPVISALGGLSSFLIFALPLAQLFTARDPGQSTSR